MSRKRFFLTSILRFSYKISSWPSITPVDSLLNPLLIQPSQDAATDPVEFLLRPKNSLRNQREPGPIQYQFIICHLEKAHHKKNQILRCVCLREEDSSVASREKSNTR